MNPTLYLVSKAALSIPRVSGDEPRQVEQGDSIIEYSPRERG